MESDIIKKKMKQLEWEMKYHERKMKEAKVELEVWEAWTKDRQT